MSSFWMPKKQPLYAPMIASFGGGSVRGFRQPSGEISYVPRLFMTANTGPFSIAEIDPVTNSIISSQSVSGIRQQGSFPAINSDVWISSSGARYVIILVDNNNFAKINLDNFSDAAILNHGHNTNCRAMCIGHDGLMYLGVESDISIWDLETSSEVAYLASVVPGSNCQTLFSHEDGHIYTSGNSGMSSLNRATRTVTDNFSSLTSMQHAVRASQNQALFGGAGNLYLISFSNGVFTDNPLVGYTKNRLESGVRGQDGYVYLGTTDTTQPQLLKLSPTGDTITTTQSPSELSTYPNSVSYFGGKLWVGGYGSGSGLGQRIFAYNPSDLSLSSTIDWGVAGDHMSGYGFNTYRPRWQEFDAALVGGP